MNKQLRSYFNQDFQCDNCQRKFHNETAYSPDSSLKKTYCVNCVEETEKEKTSAKAKKQKNWGMAPIQETTDNLHSLNIDKRTLKKTGRVHLFATRVKKEWIEQLKSIAYEERKHYNEILEKALESYERERKK